MVLKDFVFDDLMDGDVVIDVFYLMVNYKDGLVLIGVFFVVRSFLMILGIDLVG